MSSEGPTPGTQGSARSYEEVEKRRSAVLSVRRKPGTGSSVLLLIFLGAAALAFYLLVVPWLGIGPTNYTIALWSAALASVALFGNRMSSRSPRHTMLRATLLALTDALAFVGFVALAAWTLIFPLLQPFPPEIVVVGVFSLIVTSAMVVVLRFVTPSPAARREGAYSDVEFSLRQLGEAVEQLSRRLPQGTQNVDPAVAERLSSMMSEVAAMRKEFTTLRSSSPSGGQAPVANPGVSGLRVAPDVPERKRPSPVTIFRASDTPPQDRSGAPHSSPDSTVDNPWLDVLGKRRKKSG